MTDHQFRVIADRDNGDDVDFTDVEIGDRLIHVVVTEEGESDLIRIERPVPTTDMTAMSHETTGFCFCGQMHGQVKDWNEHDWAALRTHAPSGAMSHPSVPTREQIALDAERIRIDVASLLLNRQYNGRNEADADAFYEGVTSDEQDDALATADAVLALLQEGGER